MTEPIGNKLSIGGDGAVKPPYTAPVSLGGFGRNEGGYAAKHKEVQSMNILADESLRLRLSSAFPKAFVNMHNEFIVYPPRNIYFRLDNVSSELELKCKVLEWCSREAHKSVSRPSKKYHFEGINKFLGTAFSHDDMELIYTYLGNNVNRDLAIKFVESGFDVSVLKPQAPETTEIA